MYRKTCILIILMLSEILLGAHSYADELTYLSKMTLSTNDDLIYSSKRCASVSLVMLLRVRDKNDLDVNRNLSEKYMFFSKTAGMLSIEGKAENLSDYLDQSMDDIKSLSYIYGKIMDDNYLMTGKTIPDIVNNDTMFCSILYNRLNK